MTDPTFCWLSIPGPDNTPEQWRGIMVQADTEEDAIEAAVDRHGVDIPNGAEIYCRMTRPMPAAELGPYEIGKVYTLADLERMGGAEKVDG